MTIENGQIIIDLTGSLVTVLILAFWTTLGWYNGFRYILTTAIFVTLGYLLTVRSDVIVNFVNGFYNFFIRFFNFLSPNLAAIFPAPPIIPTNAQAPLLLRVIVFVIFLVIGIGWTGPWETVLPGWQGARQMRLLGALTGLYIGFLTISATAIFWQSGSQFIAQPNSTLALILNSLSTYSNIIPVLLAAFLFLLLIAGTITFFRGLRVAGARK